MTTELKTIVLPSTATELQTAIKKAIEYYQGSPVVNDNKLRESLAKALDFKNYNQLSASLKSEKPIVPMNAYYSEYYECTLIEGIKILDVVFDEELVGYKICERDDEIDNLYNLIAGLGDRDSVNGQLMKNDLSLLNSLTDPYIISNIWDNQYISPTSRPERFNEVCEEILAANKEFIEH